MKPFPNASNLKEIRYNAQFMANKDGYDQAIIKECDGIYSFARMADGKPTVPLFYDEKVVEIVKPNFK